jgi:hypothetical protein
VDAPTHHEYVDSAFRQAVIHGNAAARSATTHHDPAANPTPDSALPGWCPPALGGRSRMRAKRFGDDDSDA